MLKQLKGYIKADYISFFIETRGVSFQFKTNSTWEMRGFAAKFKTNSFLETRGIAAKFKTNSFLETRGIASLRKNVKNFYPYSVLPFKLILYLWSEQIKNGKGLFFDRQQPG